MEWMLALVLLLDACKSRQWVGPGAKLYTVERDQSDVATIKDNVKVYQPQRWLPATITAKDDHVVVKLNNGAAPKEIGGFTTEPAFFTNKPFKPVYLNQGRYPGDILRSTFRYNEGQFFLQPLTIALKFRNEAIPDTIPAQAESAFNIGFVYGYKLSKIYWHPNKNCFNSQTERYGISIGGMLSIGSMELNDKNTRDPKVLFSRKVPLLSYGALLSFSAMGVNFGIAVGRDKTFTKNTDGWLYEGKTWTGLVVGIDLIK